MKRPQTKLQKWYPGLLVMGGFLGLVAAFILTLDKFEVLKNPNYNPACNINPVLSCGSVIATEQASAFGFPNPIIGLVGFSVVITVGMSLLAGARYKRWFWRGLQAGTVFGIVFIHWLIYQSLYNIKALCIYCMLVWLVTWPIFWYTTLYNLRENHIPTPPNLKKAVSFLQRHHFDILITWYVLIVLLILENFWYYWKTIL